MSLILALVVTGSQLFVKPEIMVNLDSNGVNRIGISSEMEVKHLENDMFNLIPITFGITGFVGDKETELGISRSLKMQPAEKTVEDWRFSLEVGK